MLSLNMCSEILPAAPTTPLPVIRHRLADDCDRRPAFGILAVEVPALHDRNAKRFEEAIPPLEAYEKLAPDSPTGHYQLALAYTGVGRKEDANREAALQRESAASLEQVKRKVAEGLEQQKAPDPGAQPQTPRHNSARHLPYGFSTEEHE